jgi:excisionase family DNA binding protein
VSDPADELELAAYAFARAIVAVVTADEPDRNLSVTEAAARLGISRSSVYNLMTSGKLAFVQLGRRRLVPSSEVRRLTRRATG